MRAGAPYGRRRSIRSGMRTSSLKGRCRVSSAGRSGCGLSTATIRRGTHTAAPTHDRRLPLTSLLSPLLLLSSSPLSSSPLPSSPLLSPPLLPSRSAAPRSSPTVRSQQPHGYCSHGTCLCAPGFSGADCTRPSCPAGCNQRGECEGGRCFCEPGWGGEDCSTPVCPSACHGNGHCRHDASCECYGGYTGDDCSIITCAAGCEAPYGTCYNGPRL